MATHSVMPSGPTLPKRSLDVRLLRNGLGGPRHQALLLQTHLVACMVLRRFLDTPDTSTAGRFAEKFFHACIFVTILNLLRDGEMSRTRCRRGLRWMQARESEREGSAQTS